MIYRSPSQRMCRTIPKAKLAHWEETVSFSPQCPPGSSTDVSQWPPSPTSTSRSRQPFAWWPLEPDLLCGATQLPPQGGAPDPGLSPSANQPGMTATPSTRHLWSGWAALSSSVFTSLRISHGLLTQMQCWRRHISVSSSWDGWGSLERAPESSGPSTPALWRASWPAVSPPGLETAPLATAGLCKGSCELPATLLEVSFPPSRISTPGGVQGKPGGLSKTPATRPTDCSLCCPQGDVSAASDPALADWGTAFSLRLSG